jgi:hypothetical protein
VNQYGEIEFEFKTNKQMEKMCPCSQKYNTKQVDDLNFHRFTTSFNGLFEHSDVSIQVSVFDINWIL